MIRGLLKIIIFFIVLSFTPLPIMFLIFALMLSGYDIGGAIGEELVLLWHEMIVLYDLQYLYEWPDLILKYFIAFLIFLFTIVILKVIFRFKTFYESSKSV